MANQKKDVKKYICINFGACKKADDKEIIEIDAMDTLSGTPSCPCCHQNTLQEIPIEPKKLWKYILAGVAAVAVIGGGIYGFTAGNSKTETPKGPNTTKVAGPNTTKDADPNTTKVTDPNTTKVADSNTTKVADPSTTNGGKDGKSTGGKDGKTNGGNGGKATGGNSGTVNLGYGKFSGSLKNGKPNGMGTLRYTTAHIIDSRDPKGRMAEAGDYVTGEWKDGKLVQGRWFDSSNNSKGALMIGM